ALADLGARLGHDVARLDAAVVADAATAFVREHAPLLGIDLAQMGALRATQVSDTLWQVSAAQVVNGVSVRDARFALTIRHGNVVAFGTESWGRADLRTEPTVDAGQALKAAFDHAGGRSISDTLVQEPRLEIIVVAGALGQGYAHRLVWSLVFQRRPEDARWEALVDAGTGTLLAFQDTNHYVNRQVTGT